MKELDDIAAPRGERAPSANRRLRFAQALNEHVVQLLACATATLRLIRTAQRPSVARTSELLALRALSKEELNGRRRQTNELLSELRAELRRRGRF